MKNYLSLFFLLIGLYSCNKELDSTTILTTSQENNDLLINYDGISISDIEASKVARMFFNDNFSDKTKNSNQTKTIKSIETVIGQDGDTLMYMVNFDPTGFSIISATKNCAPILAYSDDSQFILGAGNGTEVWLNETKHKISSSNELQSEEIFKNRIQWLRYEQSTIPHETITKSGTASQAFYNRVTQLRNSYPGYNFYPLSNVGPSLFPMSTKYEDLCSLADGYGSPREYTIIGIKSEYTHNIIGPLLTTKWCQKKTFNDYLPSDDYPIGCVTVAVGQIINFHKFPNDYNWSNIPDNFATDDTRKLLINIGGALDILYEAEASSATDNDAKRAFESFGYNATLCSHDHSNVKDEITRYKRPVYMSGVDRLLFPTVGHAWVCDGTKTKTTTTNYLIEFLYGGPGYYNFSNYGHYPSESSFEYLDLHMNWGWGGESDGWYIYNSTQPTDHNNDYHRLRNDIFISKK